MKVADIAMHVLEAIEEGDRRLHDQVAAPPFMAER